MSSPDHGERGHSKLGASSASRWMSCPGSVRLLDENPKPGGKAASDGTKTHELSELVLRATLDGSGEKLPADVEDDRLDRIKDYVGKCVDLTTDLGSRFGSDEVQHAIEAKFHMEELHPEFYGTGDFATWVDWEELHVVDLKDGFKEVSAVENPQLLFYASGIIRKFNLQVDRIFVHIIQPRLSAHSVDEVSMKDITAFEGKLLEAARRVEEEPDIYVPGDKQCQWCNTAVCPARQEYLQKEAAVAFPEEDEMELDLPPVGKYTTDRLLHLQKFQGAFKQLFDDIQEELFMRAQKGDEIPGKKLVQKLGNTTWKEPETVTEAALKEAGLSEAEMFTRKLKSPTQIKKVVKDKKLVDALSYRPDNGVSLVSSSAKGKAITLGNFESTIDGLE